MPESQQAHASSISHASPGSINLTCLQAFGSTASLETAYYRHTGKQLLLSEQQLMDCPGTLTTSTVANSCPVGHRCSHQQHLLMREMMSVMPSALWGRQLDVGRAAAAFACAGDDAKAALAKGLAGSCLCVMHWLHTGIHDLCTGQNLLQQNATWERGRQSPHGDARHADTSSCAGFSAQQLQLLTPECALQQHCLYGRYQDLAFQWVLPRGVLPQKKTTPTGGHQLLQRLRQACSYLVRGTLLQSARLDLCTACEGNRQHFVSIRTLR